MKLRTHIRVDTGYTFIPQTAHMNIFHKVFWFSLEIIYI